MLVGDVAVALGSLMSMEIVKFRNRRVQVAALNCQIQSVCIYYNGQQSRVTVMVPLPIGIYGNK